MDAFLEFVGFGLEGSVLAFAIYLVGRLLRQCKITIEYPREDNEK